MFSSLGLGTAGRSRRLVFGIAAAAMVATALGAPTAAVAAQQAKPVTAKAAGMPTSYTLTTTGLNPYAVNGKIAPLKQRGWVKAVNGGEPCPVIYRPKSPPHNNRLELGVRNGKIYRVSVYGGKYKTPSGAYVAMTEVALKKMYGSKLKPTPKIYDEVNGYLVQDGRGYGLGFVIVNKKVKAIHAATKSSAGEFASGATPWQC